MLKKRLLQTATLLLFVCGIVLFLAYRNGNFTDLLSWEHSSLQSSPNGGSLSTSKPNGEDSIRSKKTIMSSSKSTVLVKESNTPQYYKPIKKTTMSSSKSAILVSPYPFRKDSVRRYYKPVKSKSAIIFKPADSAKKIR